ncbi:hypothetical protein BV372_34290 [Nostoc sp. T09]|uniref:Shedu anti-phage system protein SduA domain-containing protein n=1 Tax=Nostoc sp. T09 TaxID=1932621 RepID=UPI000B659A64|nr:Shedu anti-phage system protein SduA domain-containing protein [Nostoc sp. T09]OUL18315.1 hypothetical protein BV372_34290 [Nostoc sp. T09]
MNNSTAPKSILLLAANPKGTSSLRLQEEEREIKERLRLAGYGKVPVNSTGATRPRDIQQAMLDFKPQIVHFSGHGTGKNGLVFEDAVGQEKLVSSEALTNLFKLFSKRVECVVLNACYSESQAKAIVQHINYVIGMSQAIGDHAAIEFAVGFYTALGAGESIDFAYELGCNAIHLEGIPEYLTPVLYKRDKLSPLESKDQVEQQQKSIELGNDFATVLQIGNQDKVQRYLTSHLQIFLTAFGNRWEVNECIPEFHLGADYISDFIVVTGQSFHYDIILVKLESPFDLPFTKDGKRTQRLNNALEQVNDWFTWIHDNEDYFLRSLAKGMQDIYGAGQISSSHRNRFRDNGRYREFISAKIVIGRRGMLTEEDNKRRATILDQTSKKIEILPYDRLLETETRLRNRS